MCGCVGCEGTGQVGMWERGGDRVGGCGPCHLLCRL